MATIKWETAEHMMNIVSFITMRSVADRGEKFDIKAIENFARDTFNEYCKVVGITEVEDPEEGNTEDFDEEYFEDSEEDFDEDYFDSDDEDDEEDDDDNVMYSLTVKGEFALRYMEAGHTFEEACEIAELLFGDGE